MNLAYLIEVETHYLVMKMIEFIWFGILTFSHCILRIKYTLSHDLAVALGLLEAVSFSRFSLG